MNKEAISKIIARLKNNPDQILALTWVAKDYSKLNLIRDLEAILREEESRKYEDAVEVIRDHIDSIKSTVVKRVKEFVGDLPFEVDTAFDDQNVLIVRVYNVTDGARREITERIRHLGEEMFPDNKFVLIASVKTEEITKTYYPKFSNGNK